MMPPGRPPQRWQRRAGRWTTELCPTSMQKWPQKKCISESDTSALHRSNRSLKMNGRFDCVRNDAVVFRRVNQLVCTFNISGGNGQPHLKVDRRKYGAGW